MYGFPQCIFNVVISRIGLMFGQIQLRVIITSMFLIMRTVRSFAQVQKRMWSQTQPIFKDYYSRRLTLTPGQLQNFLLKLSGKQFSEQDHRWISLLQNIQSHLSKYHLEGRVYMLKALVGMGSQADLSEKLLQSVMNEVGALSFEESALMMWNLSRMGGKNRIQDVTKIYQQLCRILAQHEDEEGVVRMLVRKSDKEQFEKNTLSVKSTTICMILSAMSKLKVTEKTILKHLLRDGLRPNLSAFSSNGLVSLLVSLDRLGLRNKRDSLNVYLEVRKRTKDLEVGPLESLQNLAMAVSNMANSTHFNEMQADGRAKPVQSVQKLRETRQSMKRFVLWLCETIQLRQTNLSKEFSAKILHYCGKIDAFHNDIWSKSITNICTDIQDCKIIDLVMSLKALTTLPQEQRTLFVKQQQQICKRLWALYSSISGKSLAVMAELLQEKKISPPPKLATILNAHITKKRATDHPKQQKQE